jgi:hypothetical protein
MDYLSTLPPDLLRETASSLPPDDVIKLIADPDLNKILNDQFWKNKIKSDFSDKPVSANLSYKKNYIRNIILDMEYETQKLPSRIRSIVASYGDDLSIYSAKDIDEMADKIKDIANEMKINEEKIKSLKKLFRSI